jgi:S1-C subfamily serine protease
MITLRSATATRLLNAFLLAVFFTPAGFAQETPLGSLESSLGDLIYGLSRSVVTIEASRKVSGDGFPATGDEAIESAVSSGIVVDSMGHIVVSAPSVVGKDRILVSFGNRLLPARLVAVDYQNELALLDCRIPGSVPVQLSSDQACAGQMVVAIGNAFGVRSAPSLGFCAGVREDGMMQFSIPMTSGAVGGGVFDLSGRLVAIITGGLGEETRVTTAVPAYRIRPTVEHLLRYGDQLSGFAGITTREIEIVPGLRVQSLNSMAGASSPADYVIDRGVLVTSVVSGSPAERAGLAVGDLVFGWDQMAVNSAAGLASLVRQSQPGRVVQVDLVRQNLLRTVFLEIGQKTLAHMNIPAARDDSSLPDQRRIDSLRTILRQVQSEIDDLERRLDRID